MGEVNENRAVNSADTDRNVSSHGRLMEYALRMGAITYEKDQEGGSEE